MVSPRGPVRTLVGAHPAAAAMTVEEYGYGLGPPTGILVLRYRPQRTVADFPADRDDFLHQLFWSPDGMLSAHRGDSSRFVSSGQMLWVRRGASAEVRALDRQTVLRVCVRQVPADLTALDVAVLAPDPEVGAHLLSIARPGVSEADGLRVRSSTVDALARCDAVPIEHMDGGSGPARAVAQALLRDPSDSTSLAEWAARLHVSAKTLQRDFVREFALTFTAWRTETRLRAAAAMLHDRSVTETAHRVGYASASAFVAAFTREYGTSPGRYVA